MPSTPTQMVVSSGAKNLDGVLADAENAPADAILEVRLDLLDSVTPAVISTLRKQVDRPLMATLRSDKEGGRYIGGTRDATALLQSADQEGFEWIDLEAHMAPLVQRGSASRVISWHAADDLNEVPLAERMKSLAELDADVIKVAITPDGAGPAFSFVEDAMAIAEEIAKPTVAIPMGRYGRWLRLLAPHFGMPFFYASARDHKKTAAGQVSRREAEEIYRWRRIRPDTKVFAIVGGDVSKSLSPRAHNEVFAANEEPAVYIPIDAVDFDALPAIASKLPLSGMSITAPHKIAALESAHVADPISKGAGVSNTLLQREPGRLNASNTDAAGFIAGVEYAIANPDDALALCVGKTLEPLRHLDGPNALRSEPLPKIRKALICGTGGAARAVAFGLIQRKVRVAIMGRDSKAAVQLALVLGHGTEALSSSRASCQSFDLLVKATPDVTERLFDPFDFAPKGYAADVVYSPIDTDWLLAARRVGRTPIPGLLMFSEQAVLQAALFTGRPANEVRPAIADGIAAGLGRS